ncbi:PAXIP1-associated glutamate-rich protein 1A-like [Saccostrea echinata]|uniref:PAXIP1-associated glutamate-rich protein 1A-like n=1 Tax=Saccostrea echinata TaxID=191078 RepID=UPI002A7ED6A5|nr:PAXIP1-associated glutamate-rich protein 1A-like [Saccostrea echinata]
MDTKSDDDWQVQGSDDEKYDPGKKGNGTWCPLPEDIIKLYEALAKEKVLKLEWKCPGRHLPKAEKPSEDVKMKEEAKPEIIQQPKEDSKQVQSTEFDFDDDDFGTTTKVTPQRLPGNRTPRTQKKVATMDKILQDVMKQRIQNSADRETKRRLQRSPRTPGSTPVKPPTTAAGISSPAKPPVSEFPPNPTVSASSSTVVSSVTESSETKPVEMETEPSSETQNTAVK